jgi:hypothetical protein
LKQAHDNEHHELAPETNNSSRSLETEECPLEKVTESVEYTPKTGDNDDSDSVFKGIQNSEVEHSL